jgi:phosphoribosyl-AMP cyclohydrolase
MALADLDATFVAKVIAACREREPSAAGILVHGSYVTGSARPESDLDLDIFISDEPTTHYRTWFQPRGGAAPLHISARSDLTVETWNEEEDEPAEWSFGLPVAMPHEWLWVGDPHLVEELGEHPVLRKPPGTPEIEDMVDAVIKMLRHAREDDELGARLHAVDAARCAAPTVAALNDPNPVTNPRGALTAVLALPIAPDGWARDLPIALGLTATPLDDIVVTTKKLVVATLRLVREVNPSVDGQPEIGRYILDGTLEGLLT